MNKDYLMEMVRWYIAKGDLASLKKAKIYLDKAIREGEKENEITRYNRNDE